MPRRSRLTKRSSRVSFKRGSKTRTVNVVRAPMRGGWRM